MRNFRWSRIAVALVVPVLVLAGCSSSEASDSEVQSAGAPSSPAPTDAGSYVTPRTMPEGKGSGESDGVFPRTVVHFQGETTLSTEPKKIVVVSTGQSDALLTLGIVPAGSTSGDGADLIPPYLTQAFPQYQSELKTIADVGGRLDPSLEAIATVEPDLILMNTAGKDAEKLYANLSAVAPTVATQGTGLYWKQDLLLLADAVGKRDQAQQWLDDYQADAAAFGETVDGDPTVSFLRQNGDRMRVFGVASFSGSVAEDSGLPRPDSQTFTDKTSEDISGERLEVADADWIFYGVQGGDTAPLTGASLWPTLGAVTSDKAIDVDDDVFYLNVGPTAANQILSVLKSNLSP